MTLGSIQRGATPIALFALLTFGCATVRAPANSIQEDVRVDENGAEPQVELWLESGQPVTPEEKREAVSRFRSALDRATATLVSQDEETLLVVRAQGIARTSSRRANQRAAVAGIVVGAVAIVAVVVVAVVAQAKGGGGGSLPVPKVGGGGGSFRPAAPRGAPGGGGGFRPPPRFAFPAPRPGGSPRGGAVAVDLQVQVPPPQGVVVVEEGSPAQVALEDEPVRDEERTAYPPREPITLHLPPPRPLDVEKRKFFDKDYTRLELLVVDRATGQPTWVKAVEGDVDPRSAKAVKALMAKAIQDPGGWVAAVPP